MQKSEKNEKERENSENLPSIPDGWELRTSGLVSVTDMVVENGVWVSLVDIALETGYVLTQVPIENFKVPVITKILHV